MKLLIFDGNNILHRAMHGYKRLGLTDSRGRDTTIIYGMLHMLSSSIDRIKPTHVALVFDGVGPTWRHKLFPDYKANRKAVGVDENVGNLTAVAVESLEAIKLGFSYMGIRSIHLDNQEADDVVATLARQFSGDVVIETNDKDLMALVDDRVLVWVGQEKRMYRREQVIERLGVEPRQVHDLLTLNGDKSDNIPKSPLSLRVILHILNTYGSINAFMTGTIEDKDIKHRDTIRAWKDRYRLNRKLTDLKTLDTRVIQDSLRRGKPDCKLVCEWLKQYNIVRVPGFVMELLGHKRAKSIFNSGD